ncbi:interferon-induced GTP-binding protein Mx [Echria macrotheca]|uniref:Interferon-induced GTP-binding protein Mx n=1 Tax=Echria macrotheca TaxID=438768 RepID=A0AAJ0BC58_9PEZI|nr:interferon-induced GTP-binding protein Mx [Echria macrotheca]
MTRLNLGQVLGLDHPTGIHQLRAPYGELLDTVDVLHDSRLGQFLELQLVVVGHRSAGKSSVLQAISRVGFPIGSDICTRFATELFFRPSAETKFSVKIQNEQAEAFHSSVFSSSDLPSIIDEAEKHMGLPVDKPHTLSDKVLRVEISGPDVPRVTLVDLPGLYGDRPTTLIEPDQDTTGPAAAISISERYIAQQNSIIIVVVSAETYPADKKVLEDVRKYDVTGARTLVVITKPDKMKEGSGIERACLRLVQDAGEGKFPLGWHVLRNRADKEGEKTDDQRDDDEATFFRSSAWAAVSPCHRGIESLRAKLAQILLARFQKHLPAVIKSIERRIKNHQDRLVELGEPRAGVKDLRKYLLAICTRFQRVALEAVQGNYMDEFFGGVSLGEPRSPMDSKIRKLRVLVRDMNRAFHYALLMKGRKWRIRGYDVDKKDDAPEYLQPLIGLYDCNNPQSIVIDDLKAGLERMGLENQGFEVSVLKLFRDLSQPWERLTNQHVELVVNFASSFVETLISHICGSDSRTAETILRTIVNTFFEDKKVELHDKVAELLRHFKTGNNLGLWNMQSMIRKRDERAVSAIMKSLEQKEPGFSNMTGNKEQDIQALTQRLLNTKSLESKSGVDKIIEYMSLYYDESLDYFANNVTILALENCLISEIPDIFTPEKLYELSDDSIVSLASESTQTTKEREEIQTLLRNLEKSLAVCQKYLPRRSASKT